MNALGSRNMATLHQLMRISSVVAAVSVVLGDVQTKRLQGRSVIKDCHTVNASCFYDGPSAAGIHWTRHHGNLPLHDVVQSVTNSTGPTGFYMRLDAELNQTGSTSFRMRTTPGQICLHFRYRMYGLAGRLEIRLLTSNDGLLTANDELLTVDETRGQVAFSRQGNQGYGSHYGEAEVDGATYDEISFVYSTGSDSHTGQVALGDVMLTAGVCDSYDQCRSGLSRNYRGMTSLTVGGVTCQAWSSQTPQEHEADSPTNLQEDRVEDAGSRCRQTPDSSTGTPWCLTTTPDLRDGICSVPRCQETEENKVRLISLVGQGVQDGAAISRVEVYHQGSWGTVCTLGWDDRDASVLCHQLGYPAGGRALRWQSEWPRVTDGRRIWLSGLDCTGNETTLWACPHSDWAITYGCSSAHYDDAFVKCRLLADPGPCGANQVRLAVGPEPEEGLCLCREGYYSTGSSDQCHSICPTMYPGFVVDPSDPLTCIRDGVVETLAPAFLNDSQVLSPSPGVVTEIDVSCGVITIDPRPSHVFNMAEGKPAYQSGDGQRSFAYRAVDGATGSHPYECATPTGSNAWLVVDLGDVYPVSSVEIFTPRSPWCEAYNMLSSRPMTVLYATTYDVADNPLQRQSFTNCTHGAHLTCGRTSDVRCRASARYVMVTVTSDPAVGFTALCEVRVYSNGVPVTFGNLTDESRVVDGTNAGRLLAFVFSRDRRDTVFTCRRWMLTAPPTKTFSVYITRFQLSETRSLFRCQRHVVVTETLKTEDGTPDPSLTLTLQRLCSSASGVWVTATSRHVTVQLTNHKVHDLVVFEALYKLTDAQGLPESSGCQGPRRLPPGGGVIVSRPDSDDLLRDTCVWIMSATPGRYLEFSVSLEVFPFTYTDVCSDWMLAFYDGEGWSGRPFQSLCRGELASVRSPGPNVTLVQLVPRSSSRRVSYTVTYTETECMGCGEGYITPSQGANQAADYICDGRCGRIQPPYIDGAQVLYVEDVSRTYRITAPTFHYVKLSFTYIRLEYGLEQTSGASMVECAQWDHVQVYTGDSQRSDVFTYCGMYSPTDVLAITHDSDRNVMRVRFTSTRTATPPHLPPDGARLGFEVTWVVIPVNFEPRGVETPGFHCDQGWALNHEHCYRLYTSRHVPVTWYAAERRCKRQGGNLVSIRDSKEMKFVHTLILRDGGNRSSTYIGLQKSPSGFRWSDGSAVSYTDWARGQPDGGMVKRCSHVTDVKYFSTNYWHSIPCAVADTDQFVCEVVAKSVRGVPVANPAGDDLSVDDLVVRSPGVVGEAGRIVLHQCHNGELILGAFRGDGVTDCQDLSDEGHLTDLPGCQGADHFRCLSGDQCVASSLTCDLVKHCDDGSDEDDCYLPMCGPGDFRCADGRCISTSGRCDLRRHCAGGEDERGCEGAVNGTYLCESGDRVSADLLCDGYSDCVTGEDERHCPSLGRRCVQNELRCQNGVCIPDLHRCHLEFSRQGHPKGCRDLTHLRDCADVDCAAGFYKCPGSYCLSLTSRCDGRSDCPGGEDENHCSANMPGKASFSCPGAFRCRLSPRCVPVRWRCDGVLDCPHGDDELLCGMFCPPGCTCEGATVDCRSLDLVSIPKLSEQTRVLYLDNNSIEGHRLHALSAAPRLRTLSLSENLITSLRPPDNFPLLLNLRHLDLSRNTMEALRQQFLIGLSHLQTLTLDQNRLTTVKAGAFCGTPGLRVLDISGQKIRNIHPEAFRCLNTSLERIVSSDYLICCLTDRLDEGQCLPQPDGVSSCQYLLGSPVYRYFLWVIGTVAIFGNILALAFRVQEADTRSPYSLLVFNLNVVDLLIGVYLYVIGSADAHYKQQYVFSADRWRHGGACAFAGFLSTVSCEAALLLVAAVVLERLLAEVRGTRDRPAGVRKLAVSVIAMIWGVSVLLAILPLLPIAYFEDEFYSRIGLCVGLHHAGLNPAPGWQYAVAIFVGFNLAICALTAICYIMLLYKLRQRNKDGEVRRPTDAVSMVTSVQSTVLVATDLVCWTAASFAALVAATQVEMSRAVVPWVVVLLLPLRAALNPLIFLLISASLGMPSIGRLYDWLTAADVTEFRDLQHDVSSLTEFVEGAQNEGRTYGCVATLDVILTRWRLTIPDRLEIATLVAKTMEEYRVTGRVVASLHPSSIYISQGRVEGSIGKHCVLLRPEVDGASRRVPSSSEIMLEYAGLVDLLTNVTNV